MSFRPVNVAIDGLAASGKTTVAEALAERMGFTFLDTGLMYRAVALKLLQSGQTYHSGLLLGLDLAVESAPGGGCRVRLDGLDVTDLLHAPEISRLVPQVATVSEVRRDLVRRQQNFARRGGIVMVGRDIATVVMPDAEVKIFLEASLQERAIRRYQELAAKGLTLGEVESDLAERDRVDMNREDSPLLCVADAHRVDTTGKTRAQVLDCLSELIEAAQTRPV